MFSFLQMAPISCLGSTSMATLCSSPASSSCFKKSARLSKAIFAFPRDVQAIRVKFDLFDRIETRGPARLGTDATASAMMVASILILVRNSRRARGSVPATNPAARRQCERLRR
jgi:hypothetical protein